MSSCCCPSVSPTDPSGPGERRAAARHWLRLGLAALIAGQSMVFSFAVNLDRPEPASYAVLHGLLAAAAVSVFLLVGLPLVRTAWTQARARRCSVEQFFLLGILGAFGASVTSSLSGQGSVYYEVVSVLLAIYSLGHIVGARQRRKALASATALRESFETCTRLQACGGEAVVPVSEVVPGDRIRVRGGAAMTVDGRVVEGMAWVSETPLNGEPFPVVKRAGDRVRAGSQVLDAALTVVAEHEGRTREIDGLLDSVEQSVREESPLQREADRIVAWFLPVVVGLSLLTTVFWTWRAGGVAGLFHGLAVLVVACPCAMGLATPIALWSTLNALARRGLVPRRGDFIERLAGVDTVVFDKTGTLSEEHLHVLDWMEAPGQDRRTLQAEVAAVQSQLAHPVARAFRAWPVDPAYALTGGVETLPAAGIAARVATPAGEHRLELLHEDAVPQPDRAQLAVWKSRLLATAGREAGVPRWVVIRRDGALAAVALLRENLRASAGAVLQALRDLQLDVRVMTGDREGQAAALGLTGAQSGMAAVDKAAEVRALQTAGHRVLFVGDGVNDAPAMACAHASVALVSGASLSREAADAQLFGSDLSQVAEAVARARATVRRIRQNLLIAAAYNLVGITLAMTGFLHPIVAAVLMLLSSATVSVRALAGKAEEPVSPPLPAKTKPTALVAAPKERAQGQDGRDVAGCAPTRWQQAVGILAVAALGVQGWALIYLGSYSGGTALFLAAFFALAACLLWSLRRHWLGYPLRTAFIVMTTVGNAGMLAGWWGDAGWAPAVREGLCLCGCTPGHFVQSLQSGTGWMHLGMFLGAVPGFWWEGTHRVTAPGERTGGSGARFFDWRWLVCLAFMWLGMQAGARAVMGWFPGQPDWQLLTTFVAMTTGMLVAMAAVCGPRLVEESRRQERGVS